MSNIIPNINVRKIFYKNYIYQYCSKNQKLHLVKKKNEENFCKNLDSDKIKKQNVNNGSKYIDQKKSKQKLFQNDKEQSKAATTTQTQ